MQIQKKSPFAGRMAPLLVLALGVGIASVVIAEEGPGAAPGKAEITDTGKSWPHEVKSPAHAGKSAAALLTEIQNKAVDALATATPETKPDVVKTIRAASACLAYDGHESIDEPPPAPLPSHHGSYGGMGSHADALAKVCGAYDMAFPTPPAVPDWATIARELEHGH